MKLSISLSMMPYVYVHCALCIRFSLAVIRFTFAKIKKKKEIHKFTSKFYEIQEIIKINSAFFGTNYFILDVKMPEVMSLHCTQRTRSFSSKSNVKRRKFYCTSRVRNQDRCSLEETKKVDKTRTIENKTGNQSNASKMTARRRNSLPDMPNIMDDVLETNTSTDRNGSVTMMDAEMKKEKNQQQIVAPSSDEKKEKIVELNKQMFSSNELQKLNDQNRELNNVSVSFIVYIFICTHHILTSSSFFLQNLDEYIVEQKLKISMEPLNMNSDRNAPKIADLMIELSKSTENEMALRLRNAELIRTKTIAESQSKDLSRKLEAANQCITDYESKITKLTAKNTELQAKCTEMRLEMNEMRSTNEKSMDEKKHKIPPNGPSNQTNSDVSSRHISSSRTESTMEKIQHYETDIIRRERMLSMEKDHLHSEKKQLKNEIVELTSKFERYQKKQDDYVRKLDNECNDRISLLLNEKRSLESKLSTMEKEMRYMNEKLKRNNNSDRSSFAQEIWSTRPNDGRHHHQTAPINLKAIASRYYRTSRDMHWK